jgi:hypothetical protein
MYKMWFNLKEKKQEIKLIKNLININFFIKYWCVAKIIFDLQLIWIKLNKNILR